MFRFMKLIVALACLFSGGPTALANWSANLGWHNPPVVDLGVNFAKFIGANLAFEVGIGWVDLDSRDTDAATDNDAEDGEDTASLSLLGDINGKYLFMSGTVRPYVQMGFGLGLSGSVGKDSGANIGTGSLFYGGGVYLGNTNDLHFYASYNFVGDHDFLQAGVGIAI